MESHTAAAPPHPAAASDGPFSPTWRRLVHIAGNLQQQTPNGYGARGSGGALHGALGDAGALVWVAQ